MTAKAQIAACHASTLGYRGFMPDQNAAPRITAVDFNPDILFVTFADGMIVTYHASFIFSVRNHDSNQVITAEPEDAEQEPGMGEPLA